MRIKKFKAKSMREALIQIKSELGEDAIILKTKKVSKKAFSLGGKEEIEVTAAIEESTAPLQQKPSFDSASTGVYTRKKVTSNRIDPEVSNVSSVRKWEPPREQPDNNNRTASIPRRHDDRREQFEIIELKENVRELREMVKGILGNGDTQSATDFSGGWAILYKKLINSEVNPNIAQTLIKKVGASDIMISESQAEKKFVTALNTSLPVSGPLKLKKDGPLIVTFIGPTGSGKTTTLAKLAAHCRINKKKKVSIITADTYRIAAIEQIRIFADIININIQVVFSPDEIATVMEECTTDDIILVDTAGRSQRNNEHMADLKALLNTLRSDEIHLVLSATTKDCDLAECIDKYRSLGVNRLLFTKLDETSKVGNIVNSIHDSGLPVSYLTTGQSVPDDIEVAQPSRFVQRLFEGSVL